MVPIILSGEITSANFYVLAHKARAMEATAEALQTEPLMASSKEIVSSIPALLVHGHILFC